jgi:hypothetical protein
VPETSLEIIKAILLAGLPTAALAYLMVFYAIKRGYIKTDETVELLKKRKKQAKKDDTEFKVNPVHQKWLYFGGGYYGLMALGTYAHVELLEIIEFFGNYRSFSNFIDQLTINALIHLIVESFMNLIPAFTWFLYWPKIIVMVNGWYWLLASYLGYKLGGYVARWYSKRNADLPEKNKC